MSIYSYTLNGYINYNTKNILFEAPILLIAYKYFGITSPSSVRRGFDTFKNYLLCILQLKLSEKKEKQSKMIAFANILIDKSRHCKDNN